LTAADRAALLELARATLAARLAGRPLPPAPLVPGALVYRGAFVTITERGTLRGCIGHIAADRELGAVVREMTVAAAEDDPRFAPIALDELGSVALEISVLSTPQPLGPPADPGRLALGRDGLIVRRGAKIALLLPQVATEHRWGPEAFLAAACQKAGLGPKAWQEDGTEVLTFQADVFGEFVSERQATREGEGEG
jgi:AmmeMemoRadiSam system protein A